MALNRRFKRVDRGRLDRVLLAAGGIGVAVMLAVSLGLISFPGAHAGTQSAQARVAASRSAQRMAAGRRWAAAACTSVLNWKNEIHRDATSLGLGLGALTRINDAISATTRMMSTIDALGLPPSAQTGQARAEVERLRSELETRVRAIRTDAHRLTSGDLGAVGALMSDLESDRALAPQLAREMRHLVSVDLGLSVAGTRACRQLVGIPF